VYLFLKKCNEIICSWSLLRFNHIYMENDAWWYFPWISWCIFVIIEIEITHAPKAGEYRLIAYGATPYHSIISSVSCLFCGLFSEKFLTRTCDIFSGGAADKALQTTAITNRKPNKNTEETETETKTKTTTNCKTTIPQI